MRLPPQIRLLPYGHRLHLSDGPIDLIVEAFGAPHQVRAAYRSASRRFVSVLDELCSELPLLRQPIEVNPTLPTGEVARRMALAVAPYAQRCFITPMAAVAGSVAEEILAAMTSAAELSRAYVNNGGDIAFHLTPGEQFITGMIERPDRSSLFGTATLHHDQPARGIATSGWRGRSFSLGIADAATVLATTASGADAAATVIANAVNLPEHSGILRERACNLAPDSDLGNLAVTCDVPQLTAPEIRQALAAGARVAGELLAVNLITSAAICLQGHVQVIRTPIPISNRVLQQRAIDSDLRSSLHA